MITSFNNQEYTSLSPYLKKLVVGDSSIATSRLPSTGNHFSEGLKHQVRSASQEVFEKARLGLADKFENRVKGQTFKEVPERALYKSMQKSLFPSSSGPLPAKALGTVYHMLLSARKNFAELKPAEQAAVLEQIPKDVRGLFNPKEPLPLALIIAGGISFVACDFLSAVWDASLYITPFLASLGSSAVSTVLKQLVGKESRDEFMSACSGVAESGSLIFHDVIKLASVIGTELTKSIVTELSPKAYPTFISLLRSGKLQEAILWAAQDLNIIDEMLAKVDASLEDLPEEKLLKALYSSLSKLARSNIKAKSSLTKSSKRRIVHPEEVYRRQIQQAVQDEIFPYPEMNRSLELLQRKGGSSSGNAQQFIRSLLEEANLSAEDLNIYGEKFEKYCVDQGLSALSHLERSLVKNAFFLQKVIKDRGNFSSDSRAEFISEMIILDPFAFLIGGKGISATLFHKHLAGKFTEDEKDCEENYYSWKAPKGVNKNNFEIQAAFKMKFICSRQLQLRKNEMSAKEQSLMNQLIYFANRVLSGSTESELLMESAAMMFIKKKLYPTLVEKFLPNYFQQLISGTGKLIGKDLDDLLSSLLAKKIYENGIGILTDPHYLTTAFLGIMGAETSHLKEYILVGENEVKSLHELFQAVCKAETGEEYFLALKKLQLVRNSGKSKEELTAIAEKDLQSTIKSKADSLGFFVGMFAGKTVRGFGKTLPDLADKKDWGMVLLALSSALQTCLNNSEQFDDLDMTNKQTFNELEDILKELLPNTSWVVPYIRLLCQNAANKAIKRVNLKGPVNKAKLALSQTLLHNRVLTAMKFDSKREFLKIKEESQQGLWRQGLGKTLASFTQASVEKIWGIDSNHPDYDIACQSYLDSMLEVDPKNLLEVMDSAFSDPTKWRAQCAERKEASLIKNLESVEKLMFEEDLDLKEKSLYREQKLKLEIQSSDKFLSKYKNLQAQLNMAESCYVAVKESSEERIFAAEEAKRLRDLINASYDGAKTARRRKEESYKELRAIKVGRKVKEVHRKVLALQIELKLLYSVKSSQNSQELYNKPVSLNVNQKDCHSKFARKSSGQKLLSLSEEVKKQNKKHKILKRMVNIRGRNNYVDYKYNNNRLNILEITKNSYSYYSKNRMHVIKNFGPNKDHEANNENMASSNHSKEQQIKIKKIRIQRKRDILKQMGQLAPIDENKVRYLGLLVQESQAVALKNVKAVHQIRKDLAFLQKEILTSELNLDSSKNPEGHYIDFETELKELRIIKKELERNYKSAIRDKENITLRLKSQKTLIRSKSERLKIYLVDKINNNNHTKYELLKEQNSLESDKRLASKLEDFNFSKTRLECVRLQTKVDFLEDEIAGLDRAIKKQKKDLNVKPIVGVTSFVKALWTYGKTEELQKLERLEIKRSVFEKERQSIEQMLNNFKKSLKNAEREFLTLRQTYPTQSLEDIQLKTMNALKIVDENLSKNKEECWDLQSQKASNEAELEKSSANLDRELLDLEKKKEKMNKAYLDEVMFIADAIIEVDSVMRELNRLIINW